MRTKYNIAIIGCLAVLFIAACDKITNPVIQKAGNTSLPNTPPDHVTRTTDSTLLKVLLEDYMGHFCTNCPSAVAAAEAILNGPNGKQVVSMEVNVGFDADTAGEVGGPLVPSGLPDTAYKVDYTTAAGNAWDAALVNSANLGVPQGMVNRIYYNGNWGEDIQYANWASVVDSLVATPQLAAITMVDSCWIKQQVFGTQVSVSLKSAPKANYQYYLEMLLVEDSVLDWQTSSGSSIQYFPHRFVLRSAINGPWGDQINFTSANSPVTKYYALNSSKFRFNSAAITTPPAVPARLWNMAHCYVVAFLYQRSNGGPNDYYVLQSQILHL